MVTQSPSEQASATRRKPPRLSLRHALFLDFDGTLVDIAECPSAVTVPDWLPALLMRMQIFLGGAVAVVSGRPLADLVSYLAPADIDLVAEHGAVMKRRGIPAAVPESAWPQSWHARLGQFAADHPGTMVEQKSSSIALHFRRVPEARDAAFQLLNSLIGDMAGGFEILPAKMAFELKLASKSKGKAITALMVEEPYRHRIPVFAGDDATDEDGFAAVEAMGGIALRVDSAFGGQPQRVRAWLAGEIGMQGVAAA
jgi:trehalose 6-phosphate phosphatase